LRHKYSWFINIIPLSEKKIEKFKKLNNNAKIGFLSRYLMGVASRLGYTRLARELFELKNLYNNLKRSNDVESIIIVKNMLESKHIELLDKVIDLYQNKPLLFKRLLKLKHINKLSNNQLKN
jgi:hypothetical protein